MLKKDNWNATLSHRMDVATAISTEDDVTNLIPDSCCFFSRDTANCHPRRERIALTQRLSRMPLCQAAVAVFQACCCRRLPFFRRCRSFAMCSPRCFLRICLAPLICVTLLAAILATTSASSPNLPLAKKNLPVVQQKKAAVAPGSAAVHNAKIPLPTKLLLKNASATFGRSETPEASLSSSATSQQPSEHTQKFLSHVSVDSKNTNDPLLVSLKAKIPLLNRLSEFNERTLYERAKACAATSNGLKNSLPLKHVQNFAYIHNEPALCSGQLFMIAAVHSNSKNFNRRATIRRTWGSLRYVGSSRLKLVFFLGSQESQKIQNDIDAESLRYRDLIQLDFQEHYRNMSLKHLSIYEWILSYCSNAQYLLKVDDDTFTDVVHVVSFLKQNPPEGYYCSNTKGAKPQRLKRGTKAKWAVTRNEFAPTRYPAYCEGFGYMLRTSQLPDLYICSMFHKFFWIDDVYVTGVLSTAAKVPLEEFWRGHGYTGQLPSLASEKILDYIFLVADHNEFLDVVWHRLWRSVLQYSLDLTL